MAENNSTRSKISSSKQAHKLFVVPDPVSRETVEKLEYFLQEARAGRLIGFAYAAMEKGSYYSIGAVGEANSQPTSAIGMLNVLSADLIKLTNVDS